MGTAPAPESPQRLYLAVPAGQDVGPPEQLTDMLARAAVAAVLLRLPGGDPRTRIGRIKALAPAIQAAGAAVLLDGNADLVARGGADGAHLQDLEALQEALGSLKPERIAGVGGLTSRHDAMSAGEAGADYVLFGEPQDGQRPPWDAVLERVAWWAEVFEVPCVGYAASPAEADELARAGADFVLAEDFIWSDSRGAAAALMDLKGVIGQSAATLT
jgi:thiamine-phosphate pyrophosphorylase